MPEINASSIVDANLGTQMVGALMAGNRKIYVRFAKYSFWTPGTFSFTLPNWASGYGMLLSGGGAGGRAGNGGNSSRGNGGQGGDIFAIWGKLGNSSHRVLSGTIGVGGAGGTSSHAYGQNGGVTTVINHLSNVYSAAGGVGNPTMTTQAGGTKATVLTDPFHKFLDKPLDSYYYNGPAGSGNAGAGQRGGGGAGGNGGIFNNYTRGGKGGDGFVDIVAWGMPPDEMKDRDTEYITLGPGTQARDQLRVILADRGLDYRTVTEIPFDIELVGSGATTYMFNGCSALTTAPEMDTSNVTGMAGMFQNCTFLTKVPDMNTSSVKTVDSMLRNCSSLTDGNVRLIGKHPEVVTTYMITTSGLTRMPFYDTNGNPI